MSEFVQMLENHFKWYLEAAPIRGYGKRDSGMWISALDLKTGRYPEGNREAGVEKRCYRWIEAPWGSNCYWDQPVFSALELLSAVTGVSCYRDAVDAYVADFLELSTSRSNGMFLWGNHYYYDALRSGVVFFTGSIEPTMIDPETNAGTYCETRPLPVDWEVFRKRGEKQVIAAIDAQARGAIIDFTNGEFNRHSDGKREYAFLESGGILAMSLAWLSVQASQPLYLEWARKVARFSFKSQNACTGLMPNSAGSARWDGYTATSESGFWARCMQECSRMSGDAEFAAMASSVLENWPQFSWDEHAREFHGKLHVADGVPIGEPGSTPYQPGRFCDPWHPLFPRHDYPFACAEACLEAYANTGRNLFRIATERWIQVMHRSLDSALGRVLYAEHYGKFIWLLLNAADVLSSSKYREQAQLIARRSIKDLLLETRFRTHTREFRFDSVDGFGFLALALLRLEGDAAIPCRSVLF